MKNKDMSIKIEYKLDISVNYLDITIINEDGQLRICIYHKPTAEPYTLDHPPKYHRNVPYSDLIHAACLYSNVDDFLLESLRIELSLLLAQYPP